ncbi:unnamed protein product [Paramecium octaurelia]|uniref:Uncharacterized protein n=1 Tax=Paramecium octaurelia TaxID=43137 RepID=A0A8S1Y065_PAROT|nr:unnamed protein product [Paramecium octaurelia]
MNRYTALTIVKISCVLLHVPLVSLEQTPSFLAYRSNEYNVTYRFEALLRQSGSHLHLNPLLDQLSQIKIQVNLSFSRVLQCTKWDEDKCSFTPKSLRIVNSIKKYPLNLLINKLLTENGLSTNKCLSYKQTMNFKLKSKCPNSCDDLIERAKDLIQFTSAQDIQDHIINKGPVVMALKCNSHSNQNRGSNILRSLINKENSKDDLKIPEFLCLIEDGSSLNEDSGEKTIRTLASGFLVCQSWHTEMDGKIRWKSLDQFGTQYRVDGRVNVGEKNQYILGYFGFDV